MKKWIGRIIIVVLGLVLFFDAYTLARRKITLPKPEDMVEEEITSFFPREDKWARKETRRAEKRARRAEKRRREGFSELRATGPVWVVIEK